MNTIWLMRAIFITLMLSGCSLYFPPGEPTASPDARPDFACPNHTATIFSPLSGAIVAPASVQVRVRWNQGDIPDRYESMEDDFGNFFISTGADQVQGDGSIISDYELPAGGTFTLEIGWYCDAANNGPTIKLASSRFSTSH